MNGEAIRDKLDKAWLWTNLERSEGAGELLKTFVLKNCFVGYNRLSLQSICKQRVSMLQDV